MRERISRNAHLSKFLNVFERLGGAREQTVRGIEPALVSTDGNNEQSRNSTREQGSRGKKKVGKTW
jgi:hypothetical protein